MKKVYKSILAATIALSTTMSIVTGFAANNDKEKNQENNSAITYNAGNEIKPDVQVLSDNGTQLTKGVDYDLSYENNVNVGKATVNITFKGNYEGTRSVNFNIIAKALSNDLIDISETPAQTYTGSAITPTPTIKFGDVTLVKDKDYTLSYTDNVNAGKAKINVSFIGNYSGTASTTFDIIADVLNQEKVSISETAAQTYTGSAITPTPTIKYGEVTLVKDKDYNLTYTDNVNIGTAKINITFINNYSGTAESSFNIIPDVLNQEKVSISEIAKQTYTGKEITPAPTIKYGDVTLVKDKDYTLTYADNVNVGTAKVSIAFIGNYSGTASTSFEITARVVAEDDKTIIIQAIPNQTYTGSEIKPEPVTAVADTDDKMNLKEGGNGSEK